MEDENKKLVIERRFERADGESLRHCLSSSVQLEVQGKNNKTLCSPTSVLEETNDEQGNRIGARLKFPSCFIKGECASEELETWKGGKESVHIPI
jgi:hypothetical protein